MRGDIKGLVLEIGDDTTKLGVALKDTEKNISAVAGELKKIETGLKFEPGNLELLGQKALLSRKEIENLNDKLDKLRAAKEQLDTQKGTAGFDEEAYRALQREIVKTENQLKGYNQSLKDTDKQIAQDGAGMKDFGDKTHDAGKKVSVFGDVLKANLAADAIKSGLSALAGAITGITSAVGDFITAGSDKANTAAESYTKLRR